MRVGHTWVRLMVIGMAIVAGGCPPREPPPGPVSPEGILADGVAYVSWASLQVEQGAGVTAVDLGKQAVLWRMEYPCATMAAPVVRGDELVVQIDRRAERKRGQLIFPPRSLNVGTDTLIVDRLSGRVRRVVPAGANLIGETCFWSKQKRGIIDLRDGRELGRLPERVFGGLLLGYDLLGPDLAAQIEGDILCAIQMRTGDEAWRAILPEAVRPTANLGMQQPMFYVQDRLAGRALVMVWHSRPDKRPWAWMVDTLSGATLWSAEVEPLVLEQDERSMLTAAGWTPYARLVRVDLATGRTEVIDRPLTTSPDARPPGSRFWAVL